MDVAALNVKVTFQVNETVTDRYGNHKNVWTDYYSCYATISGKTGKEQAVVGETVENTSGTVPKRQPLHRPDTALYLTMSFMTFLLWII